jgi:hypothetical protein
MSSVSAPFGLRPSFHPSGVIRPKDGTIASGYATTIYQNAPVKIVAAGTLELAAAGDRAIGSFQGVQYNTSDGRYVLTNRWTASTAATEIVAYYTADPLITYEIQGNGSIALTAMGSQADWTVATAGNSTAGLSAVMLDTATLTAVGSAGLRIVGLTPGPDNEWGDAFTVVQVQISEHQNVADIVGY